MSQTCQKSRFLLVAATQRLNGCRISKAVRWLVLPVIIVMALMTNHGGGLAQIYPQGLEGTDGSMRHHGENDPHLRMTPVSSPTEQEKAIADKIVKELKTAIARYADLDVAQADGYLPFPPDPSGLRIVHYVNVFRTWKENWGINLQEPGSLLYERQTDGSLKLIGAMFTAPDHATEAELNERIPLSLTRWHLHTNVCVPVPIWDQEQWAIKDNGRPRFGLESPIATKAKCDAVGGDFWPTAFGWMVHIYVFAEDPDDIWNPMY